MTSPTYTVDKYGTIFEIKMEPRLRLRTRIFRPFYSRRWKRERARATARQRAFYQHLFSLWDDDARTWSVRREAELRRAAYRRFLVEEKRAARGVG